MKIERIEMALLQVPLHTPFRTALRCVDTTEDVVVRIRTDDGHVGHGAAAPTAVITGDTRASIVGAIRQSIAPRLVGLDARDLNRTLQAVHVAIQRNTSAKAAVEIALYDLWAQHHGAPLYRILGGGDPALRTDITISVDDVEAMVAAALSALDRGYDALKIKVGQDIATDLERVRAIHSAVGTRARLRLDANQGWTAKQAVRAIRTVEDAGIALELVEQPVPARDLDGLQHVTAHVDTPVMADESAFGPTEVLELLRRRAADIVNIKLMKAGGLSHAVRIADLAMLHGVPCMIGCMIESSISVAAAAHLAAARPDAISLVDLDSPALAQYDPVEGGTVFDGPRIVLGDGPGLGIGEIRGLQPLEN